MKQTQEQWTIQQLNTHGRVSRNDALKNHITRLGAIVNHLNNDGWQIDGHWENHLFGKDYVYIKRGRSFKTANGANEFLRSL